MSKNTLESSWDDDTKITKAPQAPEPTKDDAILKAISQLRESLQKKPDFDKYMKLIGILLDKKILNEAYAVIEEFLKEPDFDKYMELIGLLLDKRLFDKANEITDDYIQWKKGRKI